MTIRLKSSNCKRKCPDCGKQQLYHDPDFNDYYCLWCNWWQGDKPKTKGAFQSKKAIQIRRNIIQRKGRDMTTETHRKRHEFLHKCFWELLKDYLASNDKEVTISELLEWSWKQTADTISENKHENISK